MTSWLNIPSQMDAILASLARIEKKENTVADVLDSVVAQIAQVKADLTTEGAEITNIISVLQGLQNGSISTTDPRFQQAMDSLTSLDNTIKSATQAMDAVAPPPPPTP